MWIRRRRAPAVCASLYFACFALLLPSANVLMAQQPVPVDVEFSLVTKDNKPIAAAPVRLVLGEGAGWQAAGAGTRFVTDDKGQYRFGTTMPVTEAKRKMPTNFWTGLVSRAESTQHFNVAAELPYFGKTWLYAGEVDYFKGGTSARLDAMRMFAADAAGDFKVPIKLSDGLYSLPGMPAPISPPGHEMSQYSVEPNANHSRWKLVVTFMRYPEPVVR